MGQTREQVRKSIAGSLRLERRAHEMTQNDLAESIDVSPSTITGWEGGGGNISLEDAWMVADALERVNGVYVSLDQLAGRA